MIVIVVMLTFCYFIMPHATLILFYHASMLTLHNSLISHVLLVATSVTLPSLEYTTGMLHEPMFTMLTPVQSHMLYVWTLARIRWSP